MLPHLIYLAAKLRLPDLLERGAKDGAALATLLRLDEAMLHRVLRAMVAVELLSEDPAGRFSLAPLGACLRSNTPGSLRDDVIAAHDMYRAWFDLLPALEQGVTPFNHAHGTSIFSYMAHDGDVSTYFNRGEGAILGAHAVLAAYDFAEVRTLVDVGGGRGAFLATLLTAHPQLHGVLHDLPHVVAVAADIMVQSGGS